MQKETMLSTQRNHTTIRVRGYGVSIEFSKIVERPVEKADGKGKEFNKVNENREKAGKGNEDHS